MFGSPLAFARFGRNFGAAVSAFAVEGFEPDLVASFTLASDNSTEGEYFRSGGSDTTFGSLFTFARTGSAWYFNSSGVLTEATSGNARRDAYYYDGSAWVKGGLQLESAAATNLLPYSKDFTNGAWTKSDVTVALDAGDVYEVTENSTGIDTPYIIDNVSITSGNDYCIAVDVKDVDRGYAFLQWTDGTNRFSINVDLSDGAITDTDTVNSPSVIGYGASSNGDGWYRLWISATSASTDGFLVVGLSDSATPSWTSAAVPQYTVSGKKIHIRYAQLEEGSVPSSPIPTNGSTVTRAKDERDVATGDWPYSATGMSGYHDRLITYADEGAAGQLTLVDIRADANNRITITLDTDGAKTGTVTLTVVNGGTSASVSAASELTPGVNVAAKIAWRVDASNINLALNGTAETQVSSPGVPDLSSADVDFANAGFAVQDRMWDEVLTDAAMETVTT